MDIKLKQEWTDAAGITHPIGAVVDVDESTWEELFDRGIGDRPTAMFGFMRLLQEWVGPDGQTHPVDALIYIGDQLTADYLRNNGIATPLYKPQAPAESSSL